MNCKELFKVCDAVGGVDSSALAVGSWYDVVPDHGDKVFRGMKYTGGNMRMRFGIGGERKSAEMMCHVFESRDGATMSVWDDEVAKRVYPYGTWYDESQRALEAVRREVGGRDVGDCHLRTDRASDSGLMFSWNPRAGGVRVCAYLHGERYMSSWHKVSVEEARSLLDWIDSAK